MQGYPRVPTPRIRNHGDRIAVVRQPDTEWFVLRDGTVIHVLIRYRKKSERVIATGIEIVGTYPPEGAAWEWGYRLRIDGTEHKVPSRIATGEEALGYYLDEAGVERSKWDLKMLARCLDWAA